MKWKRNTDVSWLPAIHNADMIELEGRNETETLLTVIHDYHNSMGDVNRVDQHYKLSYNRRARKKYYKIFMHLWANKYGACLLFIQDKGVQNVITS